LTHNAEFEHFISAIHHLSLQMTTPQSPTSAGAETLTGCGFREHQQNHGKSKKNHQDLHWVQSLAILVVPAGLEPATYGLENRCSIQLSYRTNFSVYPPLHLILMQQSKSPKPQIDFGNGVQIKLNFSCKSSLLFKLCNNACLNPFALA
jgi:hypothetical protein